MDYVIHQPPIRPPAANSHMNSAMTPSMLRASERRLIGNRGRHYHQDQPRRDPEAPTDSLLSEMRPYVSVLQVGQGPSQPYDLMLIIHPMTSG